MESISRRDVLKVAATLSAGLLLNNRLSPFSTQELQPNSRES